MEDTLRPSQDIQFKMTSFSRLFAAARQQAAPKAPPQKRTPRPNQAAAPTRTGQEREERAPPRHINRAFAIAAFLSQGHHKATGVLSKGLLRHSTTRAHDHDANPNCARQKKGSLREQGSSLRRHFRGH